MEREVIKKGLDGDVSVLVIGLTDFLEGDWLEKCHDWKMVKMSITKPRRQSLRAWVKWLWGIDVFFQGRWPLAKMLLLMNILAVVVVCLILRGLR